MLVLMICELIVYLLDVMWHQTDPIFSWSEARRSAKIMISGEYQEIAYLQQGIKISIFNLL